MICNIIFVVNTWIRNHFARYFMTWLMIASSTVLLVACRSLGDCTRKYWGQNNDEMTSVIGITEMEENTSRKYNKESLTREKILQVASMLDSSEIRVFYDSDLEFTGIEGYDRIDVTGEIFGVNCNKVFLFDEELNENGKVSTIGKTPSDISGNEICLCEAVGDRIGVASEELIGKKVILSDGNMYADYVVAGIIKGAFSQEILGFVHQYEIDRHLIVWRADYHLDGKKDFLQAVEILENEGFHIVGAYKEFCDSMHFADTVNLLGESVSVFLCLLTGIGMINSILATLDENSGFLYLLRLLGMRRREYVFLVGYLAVFTGVIGSAIGTGISLVIQKSVDTLMTYLMGDYSTTVQIKYGVSMKAVLFAVAFDIAVAFAASVVISCKIYREPLINRSNNFA